MLRWNSQSSLHVAIGAASGKENSPEIFALIRRNIAQQFVNNAEITEKYVLNSRRRRNLKLGRRSPNIIIFCINHVKSLIHRKDRY